MKILGISALYHDSAAALCDDGEIIAAAQEERFSRKKHDPSVPTNAIRYCLSEAGVDASELDAVVYYDNPFLSLDRWLKNCAALGSESEKVIDKSLSSFCANKLWIHELVKNAVGGLGANGKLLVLEHHFSHAASAFYPSPFDSAAIITLDGLGEWASTTIGVGRGGELKVERQIDYPHSLGLLYSAFTYFCGFKVNSGEYKLMGLAPYGEPVFYNKIKDCLIDIKDDGSFRLNLKHFAYYKDLVMVDGAFDSLFDGPKREPESRIGKREMNLAASIQKVAEEVMLKMAAFARKTTQERNLCLAGGVALNCVANGKLAASRIFDDIWIQPAAGDAGGALGAALYANYAFFKRPRKVAPRDSQKGSFLGPSFDSSAIDATLKKRKAVFSIIKPDDERCAKIAKLLADGMIVGFFSGRMEFGPRALGARSILANPMLPETQGKLNLKIKFRESFRPFAPVVLEEKVADYFDFSKRSPYMLLTAPVKKSLRKPFLLKDHLPDHDSDMLKAVKQIRSSIPAVTHVDYSARLQTVGRQDHPSLHKLLCEFEKITGCAVLANTSFNVRGEPIVCSPDDAYLCFMRTDMDVLVIEDRILFKEDQEPLSEDMNWRSVYELD